MTDAAMTDTSAPIELAPPDHTYLHLDSKGRPMHWAMLLELEAGGERLTLDAIRDRVAERIGLFDIFRVGIAEGRWRAPRVVLTDRPDLTRHLTGGDFTDQADLRRQLATLMETPLPRPEPLWHITLLTPRGDGAQHILLRVHHALSDGIAGAAFAALLADGTADDLSEFERFATSPRFRTPPVEPEVLKESKAAFNDQWAAGRAGRGWPKLTKNGRREVATTGISTRELRRAAKKHDATVHEFVLAAIGRTLSTIPPGAPAQTLRVTLPVTNDPEFRHTGNAVIVTPLNLLGNEPDLGRQIERCRSELATIERRRPELTSAAPDSGPALPWPVQRVIAHAAMAHMSPDIHIGINPGFSRIRAVLGRRIAELTPLSPLAGYSFSVTSLILGNRTSFGVVTDPAALPAGYAATFVENFDRVLREAAPSA
ncbi:diacylglycerol O-acyltransferase [Nocardia otitidiscaviarum]|uniref:wax ester/triacylglycerol synthase domain-containing protein n=1 Tax=Nocardia otitidiscaviarum TaxID=1823 RepID=UPI00069466AA|nr:wax ester/triacylglycerol synthase domain-containing protein [Nocardia otitidiscaviarum]MBF6133278.1 diacylglycerol O-acyltransferase [Nocardia otitidiscaviarum]MBF6486674.1 diacylglycerol O-acyltransferase [Nocardia otitidiscaviarum]